MLTTGRWSVILECGEGELEMGAGIPSGSICRRERQVAATHQGTQGEEIGKTMILLRAVNKHQVDTATVIVIR